MAIQKAVTFVFVVVFLCGSSSLASEDGGAIQTNERQTARRRIVEPELTDCTLPDYPREAVKARVGGQVTVEITVDESGTVTDARALIGDARLRDTAVEAARKWKFRPATLDGEPSKVIGQIGFYFSRKTKTVQSSHTFSFRECCPRNLNEKRNASRSKGCRRSD